MSQFMLFKADGCSRIYQRHNEHYVAMVISVVVVSWCEQGFTMMVSVRINGRKEGNVLFNDALNTFFILRLYGVGYMVKNHSDSERGNPLPPYGPLIPITARVLLYAPSHRQDSTCHGLCYTSRGALAGARNSSMGPPHEGSIRRPIAP